MEADDLRRVNESLRRRMFELSEANRRINESLEIDSVLQLAVDGARVLTGAQYGALTLLNVEGQLQDIVTSGLSPEEHQQLLEIPDGQALREHFNSIPGPQRVRDLSRYLMSEGLPEFQMPVEVGSCLAVPVLNQREPLGNIVLTKRTDGGEFTPGDEEILVPSPADIGTSIRNELNSGHHTARMFRNMSASKYRVELTESQKRRLSEVAHRGKSPARTVKRALALLKADEGQIDNRIADALSISRRTVVRIRKRFCEEGLESALVERARPGQKRKLDERAEAHLVAIACSDPPEGHAHWTLKLLADKAVELGYVESIARETMRQSLKKTNLSRGRTRRGASRN